MSIYYVSDIHADFYTSHQNPNRQTIKALADDYLRNTQALLNHGFDKSCDVLVVAGDISHQNAMSRQLLLKWRPHFHRILVVWGNHDFYLTGADRTLYDNNSRIKFEHFKHLFKDDDVIHILDNEIINVNGVRFYGSTMWYAVDTPKEKGVFKNHLNDSSYIEKLNIQKLHHVQHEAYDNAISNVDVVISHVPLTQVLSHTRYGSDVGFIHRVGLYAPVTIQGHCHEQAQDYFVDINTKRHRFYMNAVGYPGDGHTCCFMQLPDDAHLAE